jgi:SMC interacting uncharacterized protein involved in chromosome segregation
VEKKTKIVIAIITGSILLYAAGFGTCFTISKIRETRSIDRLERILGDGEYTGTRVYEGLEQRLKELDGFRETAANLEAHTDECLDTVEQSRLTIGQLGNTVERIGATSTGIGDTIRQLKEGQSKTREYVTELENNNIKLEKELRRIQDSIREQ